MIIDVKKYVIIGAKEDLDTFFTRAQEKGAIEFISPSARKHVEVPQEVQHLALAMRILRKLPLRSAYTDRGDLSFADELAMRIIELKEEVEKLAEEKRLLEAEIARVAPFGDFSMDDIDFIEKEGKREIQFFCMKSDKSKTMQFSDDILYIGTEYDLDYFIAINPKVKHYPDMIEMRIDRPLGELQTHLNFVKESLNQLDAELKGFAGHIDFLHSALLERLNDYHLFHAKRDVAFPIEHSLFAVEAWIPKNKVHLLDEITEGLAVHFESIPVEENERVPTYMENKGVNSIGEDLVLIYEVPGSMDKDPSGWVFWFFALFFAMIVADGGYGFLYLGFLIYLKFKFPNINKVQKRFLKLGLILSCGCILWGVLTSAYFGISIHPDSWLGRISIVQQLATKKADYHLHQHDDVYQYWAHKYPAVSSAKNGKEFLDAAITQKEGVTTYEALDTFSDFILLEFSLLIGVIHLTFSFLRYLPRHWAGLGWLCFMIGGYLYFPHLLHATSLLNFTGLISKPIATRLGLELVYAGIGLAVVLALIQKRLKGLGEISNLVQVFADVLSYLRLYALGLAGASMAATFNEMGMAVGLVVGWVIILFGHSINILLGVMAGMIHGLRLNFIEWYHYSFEGGGRLLRPLMRLKPKEHV
ncbi:MAG TPA: V-type ATP synthase subunit I [Rhabdochlamydiaceae bacterium]|jgi:V/A-type H+-transporting ATPase subunit I